MIRYLFTNKYVLLYMYLFLHIINIGKELKIQN